MPAAAGVDRWNVQRPPVVMSLPAHRRIVHGLGRPYDKIKR